MRNGNNSDLRTLFEDEAIVFKSTIVELMANEITLFKKLQTFDWKIYKQERVVFLVEKNTNGKLDSAIAFLNTYQPNIGVYAGSFNPFHKGHFNILQKAEQIFDKVIIAFGKNPDKNEKQWEIPEIIKNRQLDNYEGLVTDYIDGLGYEVTLIRGLRNIDDFHYEEKQYRYMRDLKPDIKLVSIFSDIEYDHISSSGIRILEKYNKHHDYLLYNQD